MCCAALSKDLEGSGGKYLVSLAHSVLPHRDRSLSLQQQDWLCKKCRKTTCACFGFAMQLCYSCQGWPDYFRNALQEDCHVAKPFEGGAAISMAEGYAPWAYDTESARQLWDISCKLVGVEEDQ